MTDPTTPTPPPADELPTWVRQPIWCFVNPNMRKLTLLHLPDAEAAAGHAEANDLDLWLLVPADWPPRSAGFPLARAPRGTLNGRKLFRWGVGCIISGTIRISAYQFR